MSTIHVVTHVDTVVNDDGEMEINEKWDEFTGEHAQWMTEPSGVVNVFKRPNHLWASYAPGSWKVVRSAD